MTSSSTELLVDVTMPQMGVSVVEGMVVAWHKQVGDAIDADEAICDVVTDKIDTEVPAPIAGVVREILVDTDENVDVGTVIARIGTDGPVPAGLVASAPGGDREPLARTDRQPSSPAGGEEGARTSPVVRRLAAEHGIDLDAVTATGRNGRITKEDVLAAVERRGGGSAPQARSEPLPAGAVEVALTPMRRAIARHMTTSVRTAPHCTTIVEADVTELEAQRRERGLTALPIIARNVLDTLADFPALNAWMRDDTVVLHEPVHLGIAVSLGDDGLVVPVIRDAQALSVEQLAERMRELAGRARAGELSHDDISGATFTLSNPGGFGALIATPIINQPQVAILDTEAVTRRPAVVTDADGNETIAVRSMIHLCMSWDHRALDGIYAARFLTALRERLEHPA
ncbi:MAG TPA: dihydrolipoamide acetyltransferase family protein [Solirubrobacteraceae bacterium]|nr:dihydrolipoamide acetyltransferase family protein [Solirubrobacteraceae bacterium]